jgi:hypothetical protein
VSRIFEGAVYEFTDVESARRELTRALSDDDARRRRVAEAREITRARHLYAHRTSELVRAVESRQSAQQGSRGAEDRIAWIIGCGRTGSTWLSEMLAELPGIRRWHEPYFGRLFRHLYDRPDDVQRASSFFAARHQAVWIEGLRELFFRVLDDRYPGFGQHALVIKEVNTPELFDWIHPVFRSSRMVLLVRDPFDILDSYLALQKPGSWNAQFGRRDTTDEGTTAERTAAHIHEALSRALDAFERFPEGQKRLVRYEQLLADPASALVECARLVGVEATRTEAQAAAEAHRFEKYQKTGPLEFRRRGQAGAWRDSGNFTPAVIETSERVLGALRARLGYAGA